VIADDPIAFETKRLFSFGYVDDGGCSKSGLRPLLVRKARGDDMTAESGSRAQDEAVQWCSVERLQQRLELRCIDSDERASQARRRACGDTAL